jgi:hypothetical protein
MTAARPGNDLTERGEIAWGVRTAAGWDDRLVTVIGADHDRLPLCTQVERGKIGVPITGPSALCYFSLFHFAGGY